MIVHYSLAVSDIIEACRWNFLFVDQNHGVGAGNVLNALCETTSLFAYMWIHIFEFSGCLMRWQYSKLLPVSLSVKAQQRCECGEVRKEAIICHA